MAFAIVVSLDMITLFRKDGESYGLFGLHWVRNSELIFKAKFIMCFFAVPHPTPSFACVQVYLLCPGRGDAACLALCS